MSFNTLGLSNPLIRAIEAAGYETPTEIQAQAIPPAIKGSDLIGRAKTGSGKTAAFILPTLDRLEGGKRPGRGVVRALVLTPTRELAQQVADAARVYGRFTKLSSDAMYGGVSIDPQFKRLNRGIDILAATPGRLIDHLERGSVDLSQCEVLIVDEADRMFDMGFINDVKRIIARIPKNRQTLMFSATMSAEVRRLSADIMHDPVLVEVGVEGNPAESVRQQFYSIEKSGKIDLLYHLINDQKMQSVLVFSRTKHGADKIAKRLGRSGIGTGVIHSNRSQSQRLSALSGFRNGQYRVLVATDIAARGIDVVGISHVINFDTPTFAEDYVHRIGRTGRADATGDAITFVARDERDHLRKIERFVGRRYQVDVAPKAGPMPEDVAPAPRSHGAGPAGRSGGRPSGRPGGKPAGKSTDRSKFSKGNGKFGSRHDRSGHRSESSDSRSTGQGGRRRERDEAFDRRSEYANVVAPAGAGAKKKRTPQQAVDPRTVGAKNGGPGRKFAPTGKPKKDRARDPRFAR
jgi:ATP-dependent RNA helicase RhlE